MRLRDLNDILAKLPDAKQSGDQWTAPCPLPGHKTPKGHLSLKDGGDKVLVTCRGGRHDFKNNPADYQALCDFLGFESLTYGNGNRIEATYDYTDADGKLVYQVLRMTPKAFKQRRPDGNGNWVWNLKGVKRVLYRLPEVLEAVKNGQTIYICEGEKDCDNLAKIGLAASTNSGGAEKWQPELSEALIGASVVIIPDKDEPGKRHAAKVASSLYGKAASVKILELPDRDGYKVKDVSDWLMAGGTKEELQGLISEAKSYAILTPRGDAKEEEDRKEKQASFYQTDACLFEQIEGAKFLQYYKGSGKTETMSQFISDDIRILPLDSEEIILGAVKLPSDIAEYGDTLTILKEVEAHICRYLDITDSFRKFASYYILLSWLYDRFNTLPYLRFIGDTGCGKSRALDVCGGLCYKATSASGCITPAPIYRMLKKWAGTIILDEADLQNSDEYHEVTKILNCGFERNRPVIRAVKDNPDKLQILPTYGPKVFATRRRFKDAALEARCLTEIMQETAREDIPATLSDTFYKEQGELRNKLLLFRLRNYDKVNTEDTVILELHGIEPRLRQISACFTNLFAGNPEVLRDYEAFIQHHQRELIEQRANTTIGQVVEKMMALVESHTIDTFDSLDTTLIPVSAGDIAESLNMTPQSIGQIIKTLGLETKFIKGKSKRCIVYDPAKLAVLKRRYIPQDDEVTSGTVAMVSMVSTIGDSMPDIDTTSDFDDYDAQPLLGLTPEQVIEIWQGEGSPPIELGPGEVCHDLVKILSHGSVNQSHLDGVGQWLRTTLRGVKIARNREF